MQDTGTFGTVHLQPDLLEASGLSFSLFVQQIEKLKTYQPAPAEPLFAPHIKAYLTSASKERL